MRLRRIKSCNDFIKGIEIMAKGSPELLSAENVCRVLLNRGLISKAQKDEIFKNKNSLQGKLEKLQMIKGASKGASSSVMAPVTIIDSSDPCRGLGGGVQEDRSPDA